MKKKCYVRFVGQILCLSMLLLLLAIPGSRQIALAEDGDAVFEALKITKYAERTEVSDFTLPSLDGGEKALNDYKGDVILLNFWTTW
ncbi:MAG: redoxin domain-containing protein [bacterium]|nr:redoxin domain-containing protein [bacterium]